MYPSRASPLIVANHALLVLVVARGEAKQSCSHRIQSLGLFAGLVEGVSFEISCSKAGSKAGFCRVSGNSAERAVWWRRMRVLTVIK
jgi:hypothetical protein